VAEWVALKQFCASASELWTGCSLAHGCPLLARPPEGSCSLSLCDGLV
jgi:hypothetical protein